MQKEEKKNITLERNINVCYKNGVHNDPQYVFDEKNKKKLLNMENSVEKGNSNDIMSDDNIDRSN